MPPRSVVASPQLYARIGGALYLALIGLGIYLQLVMGRVIVSGDATATAANLVAMEAQWRLAVACELLALVCVTALAMIYFVLLRPVNRELNLLATFLRMVGIAVEVMATLSLATALFPLGSGEYLAAFTPDQLHAMAYLAIKAHGHGYAIALLFFGFTFLFHGRLIYRSGYLPTVLGLLIQIAGVAYLVNSFALFLAPSFQARIFPLILAPAFVAELSLCLWLLARGVNIEQWEARQRAP
ncbi:MAG TPA: DUF4386 domain-containing protein [Vicinamibacterales bacterium]|nr:DUF4386 domain-containing protein [Vicinamibacterales bacterium]